MSKSTTPVSFFLKGLAALAALFLVTLFMAPRPEVNILRAMIGVGMALVCGKLVLRRYGIDFPRRRE